MSINIVDFLKAFNILIMIVLIANSDTKSFQLIFAIIATVCLYSLTKQNKSYE